MSQILSQPAWGPDRIFRAPATNPDDALPSKEIVGSKAHNLMRMARHGLPVPPAFVLSAAVCRDYVMLGRVALAGIESALAGELAILGQRTGRLFGDTRRPLLVSVRSGAAISMPGMMETVLNVGLTPVTLRALVRMTGNPHLAQDCRRRLIQQYGEVVHHIAPARFEAAARECLSANGSDNLDALDTSGLEGLAAAYEEVFESEAGRPFPDDPMVQLTGAIEAVLRSWSSERATTYRRLNGIDATLGTAVTIQAMVFGNLGPASGSGVGFTRNPSSGENELYVDFLVDAQGEDVVAGRRQAEGLPAVDRCAPAAMQALAEARSILEREFGDMQDFEFTIEDARLFLLQSRAGKRTPLAALRIAHDLVAEGAITPAEALARLEAIDLDRIEVCHLATGACGAPIATGTPAGMGVAVGIAAFEPERVEALAAGGRPVILLRSTAETDDIAALASAEALVTREGARTSHAAVVARQLGKPCIVGCGALSIDPSGRRATLGAMALSEGDPLSIDGASGEIFRGALEIIRARPTQLLETVALWRQAVVTAGTSARARPPARGKPAQRQGGRV